jgi:sRNA-binding protein
MTETTTAKAAKTKAPAETRGCACGCGESVERVFRQGHDQRLISKLASDLVYGDIWNGRCMGILKGAAVRDDIQTRIDTVAEYMRAKLTEGLAAKFEKAAARAWELEKTKDERAAAKAARKAEAAAKPKRAKKDATPSEEAGDAPKPARKPRNTKPVASNADVDALDAVEPEVAVQAQPGQEIRVKIGKRTINATVRGMNQAGKVTAVAYRVGKNEIVKNEGQFEVVSL